MTELRAPCYPQGTMPNPDTMTKQALRGLLGALLDDPMGYVIEGLRTREESSISIARELGVSAATIRSLRNGTHSGALRVDLWAELVRWLHAK